MGKGSVKGRERAPSPLGNRKRGHGQAERRVNLQKGGRWRTLLSWSIFSARYSGLNQQMLEMREGCELG